MAIAADAWRASADERGRNRVMLLGTPIDAIDHETVEARLDGFVRAGRHHQIVTVNSDFLAVASRDPAFKQLVTEADLVVPDGAPIVWAARLLGYPVPQRVTGPDLITMAVRHSQRHGSSLYFLGGDEGVGELAARTLSERMGAFNLAGVSAPRAGVDDAADARIARDVRNARPDFVFVGFGCPKQDFWIQRYRHILGGSVCAGIGGSFNYLSGRIRRAPVWAQRHGLEWAFRLKAEPRRLARRYLIDDLPVVLRLCREAVRK